MRPIPDGNQEAVMREMAITTRDLIPDPRAARAGEIAQPVWAATPRVRTCVRCGQTTTFVPADPAGCWYTCTGCGRYA
jgi:hypothetical protein